MSESIWHSAPKKAQCCSCTITTGFWWYNYFNAPLRVVKMLQLQHGKSAFDTGFGSDCVRVCACVCKTENTNFLGGVCVFLFSSPEDIRKVCFHLLKSFSSCKLSSLKRTSVSVTYTISVLPSSPPPFIFPSQPSHTLRVLKRSLAHTEIRVCIHDTEERLFQPLPPCLLCSLLSIVLSLFELYWHLFLRPNGFYLKVRFIYLYFSSQFWNNTNYCTLRLNHTKCFLTSHKVDTSGLVVSRNLILGSGKSLCGHPTLM